MCELCDGSFPRIESLEVARTAQRLVGIDAFGPMHAIVDDCNVDDANIEYALADERLTSQERAACNFLLALDEDSRISAIAKSLNLWGCEAVERWRQPAVA